MMSKLTEMSSAQINKLMKNFGDGKTYAVRHNLITKMQCEGKLKLHGNS